MSVNRYPGLAALLATVLAGSGAFAQEGDLQRDRFYSDKVAEDDRLQVQGSLTSSTYVAPEIGGTATDGFPADNASPIVRLYTELRARLDARNLASQLDLRTDTRVRVVPGCAFTTQRTMGLGNDPDDVSCRFQSGTYGGNELEVRELYARHGSGALDLYAGRQVVAEVGATRIDGVRAEYRLSEQWSVLGFGGLYPSRISRSVLDDYLGTIPLAVGVGSAYRYGRYFGSFGAAGVVPLVSNAADGSISTPRTFITSNGYWRPSDMLDVYHFVSVDVTGESTEELSNQLTNASFGVNLKPVEDLRLTASMHHFSTDTLDEYARERLEQNAEQGVIQNNVDVLRLSAQAAQLGASLAFMDRRFEISTSFQVRRRPLATVCAGDDLDCMSDTVQRTNDAWSGEAMLALVDRRSIGGLRLGASVSNMFGLYELGLGNDAYGRSNYLVARLDASRGFMQEQLRLDADVSYLHAEDVGASECRATLNCYGTSIVDTVATGATLYYRFLPDWFAMATVNAALQTFTPGASTGSGNLTTYSNTLLSGFLRAAYRF